MHVSDLPLFFNLFTLGLFVSYLGVSLSVLQLIIICNIVAFLILFVSYHVFLYV